MRYLAIDFGEKRIGVAVSDDAERLAVPVGIVERRTDYEAIREIREIAIERDVSALVVGRPTNLNGRPGTLAERVERFAERLAAACKTPFYFVDETLTSREAESRLRDRSGGRRGKRRAIDALAATIVLQEWLDSRPRT